MAKSGLRELGNDLFENKQYERALAVFSEAVRREPADHQSRLQAAACLTQLGEKERAVTAYQACAEGMLRRDYLLSAICACKLAMELAPREKRLRDTLLRVHARAVRAAPGKAKVPPPLPPEQVYEAEAAGEELMTLTGSTLIDRAIAVLATPDPGAAADPQARPPLPLFVELEPDAFVDLVVCMAYRSAKREDTLSVEGQGGDALYVLVAGKTEVTRQTGGQTKTVGFLSGGSIFGELSLLTGAPPTATVRALTDVEFFEVRREDLNGVAKAYPSVPGALADFAQKRMARNLVATAPMFQGVPENERHELLQRFDFRAIHSGGRALVEGEHSPGLFLVLAGELVVQKEDPAGGVVSLSVLREGDVAGEISLLTGLRASATVVATRKTATAFLERNAFFDLMKAYPQIRTYLEGLSDRRLKQIGDALRPAEIIDADELVVEPR